MGVWTRLVERSGRALDRRDANGPKVGTLLLVWTVGVFAVDRLGVAEDLSSPWLALPLAPVFLIYIAERLGRVTWFQGMTLPTLLVVTTSTVFVWVLNTRYPVPIVLGYFSGAALVAALGFLIVRLWAYDGAKVPSADQAFH